ncbi:MAG: osmotically inducible protein OsmC [Chloroflexota bacterium]|nr:MAG: osmotically inducible protein OsmC [Chloroflexota bacterium]
MSTEITFPGGKKVSAQYRGFTILTDQPETVGGQNSAPSPFDYFLASIGTCAGFFVLSFCQQRNIPTDGIRLIQREERDPETHMVRKIALEIQLPEGFPERYRAPVTRAAEHCTVKRHLQNPPTIEIQTTVAS